MNWVRNSLSSLLFALFLSFALWVYVSYNENPDRSTSFDGMPVQVVGLPTGLVIVDQEGLPRTDNQNIAQVSVLVRAEKTTLEGLQQNDLRAFVDMTTMTPGDYQVPIKVELTRTDIRPSRFSLITSDPEFTSIRVEQWITRTIPITIQVQGNLPASFEQGTPQVIVNDTSVTSVVVQGPQSRVERVQYGLVVANIEQLSTTYSSSRDIQPTDVNNKPVDGVTILPAQVRVMVPIRSVVGLKRVPVLGNIVGKPATGFVVADVISDPPLITLSGSSSRLDLIEHVDTVSINISDATDTVTQHVKLVLPPFVSRHFSDQSDIVVTVVVVPLVRPFELRLPVPVTISGNNQGFDIDYTPTIVQLTISGNSTALANIDASTLQAIINVSGLDGGTYTIKPLLLIPKDLTVEGDVPSISVSLQRPYQQQPTTTKVLTATTTVPTMPTTMPFSLTAHTPLPVLNTKTPDLPLSVDATSTTNDTPQDDTDMPDTTPQPSTVMEPTTNVSEPDATPSDSTDVTDTTNNNDTTDISETTPTSRPTLEIEPMLP